MKTLVYIDHFKGNAGLSVMDIYGKVVYSEALKSVQEHYLTSVDMSGFPKGVYFVKLYGSGSCRVEKLVMQ